MTLSFAGVFADAGAIWRSDRHLVLRVAGVFHVLPVLAFVLLLVSSGVLSNLPPEQVKAAFERFQTANIVPIVLISAALDFGTFAIMNLFLQGGGRTLGEVLMIAVRRFLPFLAMSVFINLLFGIGMWLILPGLYVFVRTWLAGPAFAARPELGVVEAFKEGWRRSAGMAGLTLFAAVTAATLGAMGAIVGATAVLSVLTEVAGGSQIVGAAGLVLLSIVGGLSWTALTVLRVAAYRLTEPRQGM